MCWSKGRIFAAIALVLTYSATVAESDGFIIGLGGESDTASGLAATVFGDYGLTGNTWVSALIARTSTGGESGELDTWYLDAGIDHWFEPLGFRLGGGYWGDDRILDSNDLRASMYFRNDNASVSVEYERREFDFTIGGDLLPLPRTIEFHADGYGLSTHFDPSDTVGLSLGGMTYNYSRNINLQPNIDILRLFSSSRLGLMNSLLDYRVSAGINYSVGLRTVDIRLERWRTAIDQGHVDSVGIGFLTPVGARSDLEFRCAYDRSENFGETLTFSVFYYFFGS